MTGVKFGNTHSDTLGLRWLGTFVLSPPTAVTKYVNIPGRNGSLDYSNAITGYEIYEDRYITMDFEMETTSEADYETKLASIMNLIHGKRLPVILDSDPGFQWDCRLSVSNTRSNSRYCNITITGTAYPYKRKTADTVVEETVTGVATEITCDNLAEPVIPTIETSASMQIKFGNKTFNVQEGTHTLDILFMAGENVLTVTGTGTIKITYREGSL
jgi:hypothetical protein